MLVGIDNHLVKLKDICKTRSKSKTNEAQRAKRSERSIAPTQIEQSTNRYIKTIFL